VVYEYNDTIYIGGGFTNSGITPLNHIAYIVPNPSLPIELANFDAWCDARNKCVELNWETFSEHENYGFWVERSIDGHTFSRVKFIDGAGTCNISTSYDFCDYEFPEGVCYYRLRQIDYSGESSVTKTLAVKCHREKQEFEILPNIATDVVDLNAVHDYRLYDIAGKLVQNNKSDIVNLRKLSKGMYILQILNLGKQISFKIVKK
jgi:hypothetical protein